MSIEAKVEDSEQATLPEWLAPYKPRPQQIYVNAETSEYDLYPWWIPATDEKGNKTIVFKSKRYKKYRRTVPYTSPVYYVSKRVRNNGQEQNFEDPFNLENLRFIDPHEVRNALSKIIEKAKQDKEKPLTILVGHGGTCTMNDNMECTATPEELMKEAGSTGESFLTSSFMMPEMIDSSQNEIDYMADIAISMSWLYRKLQEEDQRLNEEGVNIKILDRFAGFIVCHGTDTVCQSQTYTSFMLGSNCPFNLFFICAQKRKRDYLSDVGANFKMALDMSEMLTTVKPKGIHGVCAGGTSGGLYAGPTSRKITDQEVELVEDFSEEGGPIINAKNFGKPTKSGFIQTRKEILSWLAQEPEPNPFEIFIATLEPKEQADMERVLARGDSDDPEVQEWLTKNPWVRAMFTAIHKARNDAMQKDEYKKLYKAALTEWDPRILRGYSPVLRIHPFMGNNDDEEAIKVRNSKAKAVVIDTYGSYTVDSAVIDAVMREARDTGKLVFATNPVKKGSTDHKYAAALYLTQLGAIPLKMLDHAAYAKLCYGYAVLGDGPWTIIKFMAANNFIGEQLYTENKSGGEQKILPSQALHSEYIAPEDLKRIFAMNDSVVSNLLNNVREILRKTLTALMQKTQLHTRAAEPNIEDITDEAVEKVIFQDIFGNEKIKQEMVEAFGDSLGARVKKIVIATIGRLFNKSQIDNEVVAQILAKEESVDSVTRCIEEIRGRLEMIIGIMDNQLVFTAEIPSIGQPYFKQKK